MSNIEQAIKEFEKHVADYKLELENMPAEYYIEKAKQEAQFEESLQKRLTDTV